MASPLTMDGIAALPPPPTLETLNGAGPIALFLDFDGTLVEIAPGPDEISVPQHLFSSLETLAKKHSHRLALVSGRSLEDIAKHIGNPAIARSGSHGAEVVRSDGTRLTSGSEELPDRAIKEMQHFSNANGLHYEAKSHGGALHYRAKPEMQSEALAFADRTAKQYGLATKSGKCVVELVQKGSDKGAAVRTFMTEAPFAGAKPIFVGDDVTDEDGFKACREMGGFGIRVGPPQETAAEFGIADVSGVYAWLEIS